MRPSFCLQYFRDCCCSFQGPSVCSQSQLHNKLTMHTVLQNVSVSCMLSQHSRATPAPVALILLQLLLPFAILAALCIAWAMWTMWAMWRQHQTAASPCDWPLLGRQLELIAYSVLGYYYPSLVQASLSVFSCLTIDHPIPSGLLYQSAAQVGACCRHIGYLCLPQWCHACFCMRADRHMQPCLVMLLYRMSD